MARLLLGLAVLLTASCGVRDNVSDLGKNARWEDAEVLKPTRPLAKQLRLLIWHDYLDPEILEYFTRTYGVELKITFFENNSELKRIFAAQPASFDLIMPSDYVVERLIKQNLLAPLNKENLPNLGYIAPVFFRSPYDRELVYSVPLFYSCLGVTFNNEYLREVPRDYSLKSKDNEENLILYGYRALLDEPRVSLSTALMDAGYAPNVASVAALTEVTDRLKADIPKFGFRFLASGLPDALAKNQILIAVNWSGAAGVALAKNPAIRFVLPDGPKVVQVDSFVIPRTSPNQSTAEFFLNFLLLPKISGALVNYSYYASPNDAARPFIDREILLGPAYVAPPATARVFFSDLGDLEDEFEVQWNRLPRTSIASKVPRTQSRSEQIHEEDLDH
jgi:spermidine/putrescine transport system substrate-binding protein